MADETRQQQETAAAEKRWRPRVTTDTRPLASTNRTHTVFVELTYLEPVTQETADTLAEVFAAWDGMRDVSCRVTPRVG